MDNLDVIFWLIGVLVTIAGVLWGGQNIVARIKQGKDTSYSPVITGDQNVVIQIQDLHQIAQLKEILAAAQPGLQVVDQKKSVEDFKHSMARPGEELSKVLIKAIDAAKTLGREQDRQWLESELLGYKQADAKSIPNYRKIEATLYIEYQNESGYPEVMDLPYPLRWAETVTRLEEMMKKTGDDTQAKFTTEVPIQDWMRQGQMGKVFGDRETFPIVIKRSELEKILSGLRRRLHEFLLSL